MRKSILLRVWTEFCIICTVFVFVCPVSKIVCPEFGVVEVFGISFVFTVVIVSVVNSIEKMIREKYRNDK